MIPTFAHHVFNIPSENSKFWRMPFNWAEWSHEESHARDNSNAHRARVFVSDDIFDFKNPGTQLASEK